MNLSGCFTTDTCPYYNHKMHTLYYNDSMLDGCGCSLYSYEYESLYLGHRYENIKYHYRLVRKPRILDLVFNHKLFKLFKALLT
jgi:hypothetical protein